MSLLGKTGRSALVSSCFLYAGVVLAGLLYVFGVKFFPHDQRMAMSDFELRACDFTLRLNESACVWAGADPFKVYRGESVCPPFGKPSDTSAKEEKNEARPAPVVAYPPWEYSLSLPLTFLPRWLVWLLYLTFEVGVWVAVCFSLYRICHARMSGGLALAPACLLVFPAWFDLCVGNCSILVVAALLLMAYALNRKQDIIAGLCLALAMVKPQLAALFVVPLLMRKRYLTVLVAGVTCLFLALPPAILCQTSPVELILNIPAYGVTGFRSPATCPGLLAEIVSEMCGQLGVIVLGAAIGFVWCVWLSHIGRRATNWMWYLAPTFLLATSWSYALDHAYVMGSIPLAFLMLSATTSERGVGLIWLLATSMLLARPLNLVCFIGETCSGALPWLNMSEPMDACLNSYGGLLALIGFSVVYCRAMSGRAFTER